MESFRKRAATLLSVSKQQVDSLINDRASNRSPIREKSELQEKAGNEPSTPGSDNTAGGSQKSVDVETEEPWANFSHNTVQCLPPWAQSALEDNEDEDDLTPTSKLLPSEPSPTQIAQHNHTPSAVHPSGFLPWNKPEPGRRYDGQRRSEAPTSRHHPREIASRWRQFAQDSQYPRDEDELRQIVDAEYLSTNGPDFFSNSNDEQHDPKIHLWQSKQQTRWTRMQKTVLRSPFIPLIFRLLVLVFSVMALGLGANIYETTSSATHQAASSHAASMSTCYVDYETSTISPIMAIVLDSAAVLYIFGITWDEYKGLPLGLRSMKAKISVLLLDLFFIVFNSANVTLAFEGVRGFATSCQELAILERMKWKQAYLASTLLVALVAWLMTFAISVLRVVEKFDH